MKFKIFILLFLFLTIDVSAKIWKEKSHKKLNPGVIKTNDFSRLAQRLSSSVVNIQVEIDFYKREGLDNPMFRYYEHFFGNPGKEFKNKGLGTGFIINEDGYILTNNHVIEHATLIKISLLDDETIYDARVVGVDKKMDLALLKIKVDKKLSFAYLGDSDKLRVGDWVVAIGNPFGLQHTVTAGIVSAKGRKDIINSKGYYNFIQTDASINPGNSGGPLFDINGNVVGINTAIASSGQGIGFAIPINMVKGVVEQLIKFGKVKRAWLGVTIQRVSKSFSKTGSKNSEGALVIDVVKDSPAYKSGILKGDLILKFGNKKLKKSNELPILVSLSNIGDEKKLLILRDGEKRIVIVKLEDSDSEKKVAIKKNRKNQLGIDVRKATKKERKKGKGVVVSYIEENSLIFNAGIRKNDLILKINDFEVSSKEEFHKELKNRKNSMIIFYIKRKKSYLYVAFRL